jgi:hypothetical protein
MPTISLEPSVDARAVKAMAAGFDFTHNLASPIVGLADVAVACTWIVLISVLLLAPATSE